MNRRSFLRFSAIALGSIWLPGAMQGYRHVADLPRGLGLGINLHQPDNDGRLAAQNMALATLQPAWYYNWRQWPFSPVAGQIPMAHPTPNGNLPPYPLDAATIRSAQQSMAAVGVDINAVPWSMCNEPELSGWTPEQAIAATAAQVRVLWECGLRPNIIAPNCGIRWPDHLAYLNEWRRLAPRYGLTYTLSVHIYESDPVQLRDAWQRFTATLNDGDEVIITECGAGWRVPVETWLAIMPHYYALLCDPHVRALAPFSAYPHEDGAYPGMMTNDGALTPLGVQYLEYVS